MVAYETISFYYMMNILSLGQYLGQSSFIDCNARARSVSAEEVEAEGRGICLNKYR